MSGIGDALNYFLNLDPEKVSQEAQDEQAKILEELKKVLQGVVDRRQEGIASTLEELLKELEEINGLGVLESQIGNLKITKVGISEATEEINKAVRVAKDVLRTEVKQNSALRQELRDLQRKISHMPPTHSGLGFVEEMGARVSGRIARECNPDRPAQRSLGEIKEKMGLLYHS